MIEIGITFPNATTAIMVFVLAAGLQATLIIGVYNIGRTSRDR